MCESVVARARAQSRRINGQSMGAAAVASGGVRDACTPQAASPRSPRPCSRNLQRATDKPAVRAPSGPPIISSSRTSTLLFRTPPRVRARWRLPSGGRPGCRPHPWPGCRPHPRQQEPPPPVLTRPRPPPQARPRRPAAAEGSARVRVRVRLSPASPQPAPLGRRQTRCAARSARAYGTRVRGDPARGTEASPAQRTCPPRRSSVTRILRTGL